MNALSFVLRSLRYRWRAHLGVVAGAAIGTAVLVGALVVGDSVRNTLADIAKQRIGRIDAALLAGERFFRSDLGTRLDLAATDARLKSAPVLQLRGLARTTTGEASAGIVDVYGVDENFFALSPSGQRRAPTAGKAFVNAHLANHLGVQIGQTVLVRVEKPSAMPRDMVLSTIDDISLAVRVEIEAVLEDGDFARFSLQASQLPPMNLFLSLPWLQKEIELEGRANALFVGRSSGPNGTPRRVGSANQAGAQWDGDAFVTKLVQRADTALRERWSLADAELRFEALENSPDIVEMTSGRIFLDPVAVEEVRAIDPSLVALLTYFVNSLEVGERSTPYSMIGAIGSLRSARSGADGEADGDARGARTGDKPGDARGAARNDDPRLRALLELVADLGPGEIAINSWLANDLEAKVGSRLASDYYVMGPTLELLEKRTSFAVKKVLPLEGVAADPTLMPDFPGLSDSDNCRDWEPGVPVDLDRIRDTDEKYWDDHRGTPKAFLPLATGQDLWGNRFGALTSIRGTKTAMDRVATELKQRLDPARLGFFFRDLRTPALAAGTSATDFGGLFLGLSFFLILAAVLLTLMLFVFGVEQRANEVGTLLAVGYRPRVVRRLFLLEALLLATLGSLLGVLLGLLYTRLVLWGLSTLWQDAVASASLHFYASPLTIVGGTIAGILVSLFAIWLALRKAFDRSAVDLMRSRNGLVTETGSGQATGATSKSSKPARPRRSLIMGLVFAVLACGIVIAANAADAGSTAVAGAFFGAGAMLLIAGIFVCRAHLLRVAHERASTLTIGVLSQRNAARRLGRSLATIALLASGTFLVVAVQANRLEAPKDASARASGTGGFAFLGRSTIPVLRDLGSEAGRAAFGLDANSAAGKALTHATIVPIRVKEGDDASCLNLSLPQNPRLIAVRAEALAERGAFVFAASLPPEGKTRDEIGNAWKLLDADYGKDADGATIVPAIGDQASVTWAMHKSLGDAFEYRDEEGKTFRVRIVGTLSGSILQGNLVVAEKHFRARYPSASGYRMFLVDVARDAPAGSASAVRSTLTNALEDIGLELTPTKERLDDLNAVQNTYLLIFQLLGGLGLLLGSVGLGLVVLRNTLERRSELALVRAVGFPRRALRQLVWKEHVTLLLLGLGCGVVAALLALLPSLRSLSLLPMLGVVATVALSGALWVFLATALSTRGPLLQALRDE